MMKLLSDANISLFMNGLEEFNGGILPLAVWVLLGGFLVCLALNKYRSTQSESRF